MIYAVLTESETEFNLELFAEKWDKQYLSISKSWHSHWVNIIPFLAFPPEIRKFIGNPKQPTISVCNWVDGEYQISKFQNSDRLISQIFPELNLTANQIFTSGLPN